MDWELIFKFIVLFAQLAAVFAIGAWIADHIVDPIINRRTPK